MTAEIESSFTCPLVGSGARHSARCRPIRYPVGAASRTPTNRRAVHCWARTFSNPALPPLPSWSTASWMNLVFYTTFSGPSDCGSDSGVVTLRVPVSFAPG